MDAITGALEVQAKDASSALRRGVLTRWTSSLIVFGAVERDAQADEGAAKVDSKSKGAEEQTATAAKTERALAIAKEIKTKMQQSRSESATAPQLASLPQPRLPSGLSIQDDEHRPRTSVDDPRGASQPPSRAASARCGAAGAGS